MGIMTALLDAWLVRLLRVRVDGSVSVAIDHRRIASVVTRISIVTAWRMHAPDASQLRQLRPRVFDGTHLDDKREGR